MFWLGFADNSPPPELPPEPPSDSYPEPEEPKSLFTDADDDDLLDAADLDAIDESMQRAGRLAPAKSPAPDLALDEIDDTPDEDDAVDQAAADASIAFVEAHGDDGPPPAEDEPDSPMVWLVPWVISLAAHAALVIIAVFVVWSVQQVLDDDEVIVPLVTLSDTPGTPLEVEVVQRLETQTPAMAAPPTPEPTPMELDLELDLAMPGLGKPMSAEAPSFELNLNDAAEFDTNFFGSGGNAKNIVFVIEADGSIISDYPQIVGELKTTLSSMTEKQRFSIIVFDGEKNRRGTPKIKEVPDPGLKRATADAKAKAVDWLLPKNGNVHTLGTGDPVGALEKAFSLKPDLIFLLSQNLYNPGRGKYELDRREVLDAVERGARNNVVVNTIQFNDVEDRAGLIDPATGQQRLSLLAEVARMTGGEYLTVTTNALPAGN